MPDEIGGMLGLDGSSPYRDNQFKPHSKMKLTISFCKRAKRSIARKVWVLLLAPSVMFAASFGFKAADRSITKVPDKKECITVYKKVNEGETFSCPENQKFSMINQWVLCSCDGTIITSGEAK